MKHPKMPDTELSPRYNVSPGTLITAVRRADDEAPLVMGELWWGYRPQWNDEDAALINPA